jgi:hypothetical protein
MKTVLILILSLALAGAAFFTRPSEQSFKAFVKQKAEKNDIGFFEKIVFGDPAEQYLEKCKFKDRLLWVDVEKDGKAVYTGAFAHWFKRGEVAVPEKAGDVKT